MDSFFLEKSYLSQNFDSHILLNISGLPEKHVLRENVPVLSKIIYLFIAKTYDGYLSMAHKATAKLG